MERARPVIFHRSGSPKSEKALEYLNVRAVAYDTVEVKENDDSLQRLERATGQTETPTLIYNQEHIHDFSISDLANFLQKHQLDTGAAK